MKKYLFVVPSLSKGGAEKVVSLLSNELVKNNRNVTIITHFKTDKDYFVEKNVKIICLSNLYEKEYRKNMNLFYFLRLLFKLRKTIILESPDFIIPFLFTTCIRVDLALIFNRYRNTVIQTIRNNPNVYPSNIFLKYYRNFLIKKNNMTIVQNEEQKKYFSYKLHNKIFVLNNPVDNKIFAVNKKIKNNFFDIIGVGRLTEQKNFELLINSVILAHNKYSNIRLSIYGEGELKDKLDRMITEKGCSEYIFLRGRSNDYNEIYGNADLFVLSSQAEGMPNALIEAMGVGIPSISTNCPTGPSDIINNGVNGILIDINDANKMKDAILDLYENKDLTFILGKNGKKFIKNNYSVDIITRNFIMICEGD